MHMFQFALPDEQRRLALGFLHFEETKASVAIAAVDPATNTFTTAVPHGHVDGDKVRVKGGVLPQGLVLDNDYFVIAATAFTLQVAATPGGPAVDVTSPGGGANRVFADPSFHWTVFLGT